MLKIACLWSTLASCFRLKDFLEGEGVRYVRLMALPSCLQLKVYLPP